MVKNSLNDLLSRVDEMFPDEGYLCGETVLSLVAQARGIASDFVPGLATGFCSGLGRTGGTCGALSGAVLAVSLLAGRNKPESGDESRLELGDCYARVQRVVRGFEEEFGSRDCTALCKCDLTTDQGREAFTETKAIAICRGLVRRAIELALAATADLAESES